MRIKLSSGKQLRLGVSHKGPNHILEKLLLDQIEAGEKFLRGLKKELERTRRAKTEAWLNWKSLDGHGSIRGEANCSSTDNFSKRYGKKEAVRRLLEKLRNTGIFTKEDRQEIIVALCPEHEVSV